MPFKDPDKRRTYQLELYYRYHDRYKEYRRRYYYENRHRSNGTHYQIKKMLMDVLNQNECVKCGYSDIRALQFDHIYADPKSDEKRYGRHGIDIQYFINHPVEAVARIQILCANCNHIKKIENEEFRGWAWGYKKKN